MYVTQAMLAGVMLVGGLGVGASHVGGFVCRRDHLNIQKTSTCSYM